MKKGLKKGITLLSIILATSGCIKDVNTNNQQETTVLKQQVELLEQSKTEIENEVKQIDGSWMNLTTEQKLKDFDYLYKMLKENYPYFGVSKRCSMDMDERYFEIREAIQGCESDEAYFELLRQYCSNGIGHLDVWGTRYFRQLQDYKKWSEEDAHLERIYKVLDNEVSKENYKKMQTYYEKKEQAQACQEVEQSEQPEQTAEIAQDTVEVFQNVETQIIKKDEIAYMALYH